MYKSPETLEDEILQFKAFHIPMGIQEQGQDNVYMSQVRVAGEFIYPSQLLSLIDIAKKYKSNLLHITPHQEIQIQNLQLDVLGPILHELRKIGLNAKGGSGNTICDIENQIEEEHPQEQEEYNSILLPVLQGNIRIDDEELITTFQKLLKFINQFGNHTIRFTTTQDIRLRNIPDAALPELYSIIKQLGTEIQSPVLVNNIVSSIGAETSFNIVDKDPAEYSTELLDTIELDYNLIKSYKTSLETENDIKKINRLLYDLIYSSSHMLLAAKEIKPKTVDKIFNFFIEKFIEASFVEVECQSMVTIARKDKKHDFTSHKNEICALADRLIDLYECMDDTLQFRNIKSQKQDAQIETVLAEENKEQANIKFKDLRGVTCPMNFVQIKIQLSPMQSGEILEVWLDDGQAINNVPNSTRNEGHTILEQMQIENYWKVLIRKK